MWGIVRLDTGFRVRYASGDGGSYCSRRYGGFCNHYNNERKVLTKKLWILYSADEYEIRSFF